jgi:hypothetical protein
MCVLTVEIAKLLSGKPAALKLVNDTIIQTLCIRGFRILTIVLFLKSNASDPIVIPVYTTTAHIM